MNTKSIISLLVLLVLIGACKKERTCSCEYYTQTLNLAGDTIKYDSGQQNSQTLIIQYSRISKRKASETCQSSTKLSTYSISSSNGATTQEYTETKKCELK